jgi:hypothetical protein
MLSNESVDSTAFFTFAISIQAVMEVEIKQQIVGKQAVPEENGANDGKVSPEP